MAGGRRGNPGAGEIAKIETQIARIGSLGIEDLRAYWRNVFKSEVPAGLTKDLIRRAISFEIQEEVYGGIDRPTLKLLEAYANGDPTPTNASRGFKPGTELFREYQGTRHAVIVMEDGFAWQGKTYTSLTTIAKAITGTNWNGPRFFGLREGIVGGGHAPKPISGDRERKQSPQPESL